MKISCRALVLLAAIAAVPSLAQQEAAPPSAGFKVVVNAANPTPSLRSNVVSKIFLKKVTRWENKETTEPVDQVKTSPVREAFSDAIHGKSISSIQSYWQRMIFSGREVPPPELTSDAEVLAYVSANRGAIGYVTASTALGDGVKELEVTD